MDIIEQFEKDYFATKHDHDEIMKEIKETVKINLDNDYIEENIRKEIEGDWERNREPKQEEKRAWDKLKEIEGEALEDEEIKLRYDVDPQLEPIIDKLANRMEVMLKDIEMPETKLKFLTSDDEPVLTRKPKKRSRRSKKEMQFIKEAMLYDPLNPKIKAKKNVIEASLEDVKKYLDNVGDFDFEPENFNVNVNRLNCTGEDLMSIFPAKNLSENVMKVMARLLSVDENTRLDILGGYNYFGLDFYDQFTETVQKEENEETKLENLSKILKLKSERGEINKYFIFVFRAEDRNFLVVYNNIWLGNSEGGMEIEGEDDEEREELFIDKPSILILDPYSQISEEDEEMAKDLGTLIALKINKDTETAKCHLHLPVYQLMLIKARDQVETNMMLMAYLTCLIHRPDYILEASPINLDRLQWFGYTILRKIREMFVKKIVICHKIKKLGFLDENSDDDTRPLYLIVQDILAVDEDYLTFFKSADFKKFMVKSGIDNLDISKANLEKIKLEFYYN